MGLYMSTEEIEQVSESHQHYKHAHAYDVYGRKIDPNNQMPANPNQKPHEMQKAPLSTSRVSSTIPKAGTEGTWLYPSPQMFYNALLRKGKGDGVREEDMDVVIAVHNNVNERSWKLLRQWEEQRGGESKLLKFQGRPDQLTPKAWFKQWFGYGKPFDRHDWLVDRQGKTVRYVIDYYSVDENAGLDRVPGLFDEDAVKSISVDVRPAIDDFDSLLLRIANIFRPTGVEIFNKITDDSKLEGGRELIKSATTPKTKQTTKSDALLTLGGCTVICGAPYTERPAPDLRQPLHHAAARK